MLEHEVVDARWRPRDSSAAGVIDRLVWYVNRLRCMTPAEMHHRLLRAVGMQAERWGCSAPRPSRRRISRAFPARGFVPRRK